MARRKGRRLTFREEKILDEMIQKHAKISMAPSAKDRLVLYDDGWSDQRVLDELNAKTGLEFSISSVVRFRNQQMGRLPMSGGNPEAMKKTPTFLAQLSRLAARQMLQEQRLAAIEEHLRERDGYDASDREEPTPLPVKDLTTSN